MGAECERATADDDGPVRPDEKRIRAALVPKSEREAVAGSGRIVRSQPEPERRMLLLPPPIGDDGELQPGAVGGGITVRIKKDVGTNAGQGEAHRWDAGAAYRRNYDI